MTITILISLVWLGNGLFCKVFRLVPRHEQIVANILGPQHARAWTFLIGCAETLMAGWILSGWASKWSAIAQIAIVAVMNTMEFVLVPQLLLWGKWNAFFAFLFILLVYYHAFLS
jgi:hypothetical protein